MMVACLLLGASAFETEAQPAPKDLDTKYATELIKAGTVAPDFMMKTPDG